MSCSVRREIARLTTIASSKYPFVDDTTSYLLHLTSVHRICFDEDRLGSPRFQKSSVYTLLEQFPVDSLPSPLLTRKESVEVPRESGLPLSCLQKLIPFSKGYKTSPLSDVKRNSPALLGIDLNQRHERRERGREQRDARGLCVFFLRFFSFLQIATKVPKPSFRYQGTFSLLSSHLSWTMHNIQ